MSELGNIQRFIQASDEACGSYFTMEVIDAVPLAPETAESIMPLVAERELEDEKALRRKELLKQLYQEGSSMDYSVLQEKVNELVESEFIFRSHLLSFNLTGLKPVRPPVNSILGKFYSRIKCDGKNCLGEDVKIDLSPKHPQTIYYLSRLRSNGYFNVEEFLRCLRKVNEAGVFHRDIKYLNIIFMHFKYHGELLGRYEEKLIHLIDYGSVIDLGSEIHTSPTSPTGFELSIDGAIDMGTTPRNLFPLYLFLDDSYSRE